VVVVTACDCSSVRGSGYATVVARRSTRALDRQTTGDRESRRAVCEHLRHFGAGLRHESSHLHALRPTRGASTGGGRATHAAQEPDLHSNLRDGRDGERLHHDRSKWTEEVRSLEILVQETAARGVFAAADAGLAAHAHQLGDGELGQVFHLRLPAGAR